MLKKIRVELVSSDPYIVDILDVEGSWYQVKDSGVLVVHGEAGSEPLPVAAGHWRYVTKEV